VAAQRLGEERPRHGRMVQRRRMELDELNVGRGDAGAQGHRDPVAGRLGRVGRDGIELAGAAGGEDDVVSADGDGGRAGAVLVGGQGSDADATAGFDDEVKGVPTLEDGAGGTIRGVDERSFDLGARGGAAGVDDAGARVPAFAGEGERAGRFAVEDGAERDELVDPGWTFVDEDADGLLVAEAGPGAERVGEVEVGRVLVPAKDRGHATLGPPGGGLAQRAFGEDAEREGGAGSGRSDGSGEADRGRQPCDTAAENQDVEGTGALPGDHAGSVRGTESSASRRAEASSMTRLRPSTCTTRGT